MYLLYADESGAVADPSQPYFVLAGVAVFERATHWIQRDLDQIAARFNPDVPQSVELHGSPMRGGRDMWRSYPFAHRLEAIKDALRLGVDGAGRPACTLFAVVIRKSALSGVDPVEFAFEKLSSQFDLFLRRRYLKNKDKQRGLIIFDKASTEPRIQSLAREFKGGPLGTKNYADVPMFLDSRASRMIQLADLVSFATYRKFSAGDNELFDLVQPYFDAEGGVAHGLFVMDGPPHATLAATGSIAQAGGPVMFPG